MVEELKQVIESRLLQVGSSGVSVQIAAPDAVAILESFYALGKADAERALKEEISKREAEEYIPKAEAMRLLNKSDNTLWKWNKRGYLCWIKRGGTIMYRKADVMAIVNGEK